MKRLTALILVLTMLLCGCGGGEAESVPTTEAPAVETVDTTPAESTQPTQTEPAETEPVDIHPLTGEALDAPFDNRIIGVMINNHSAALPQCGIGSADILYEILAEGSTTRFMALFSDVTSVGPIGPVRSLRPYYLNIMRGYGAICTSAGGSDEADGMIYDLDYDRINGIAGTGAGYFYRDADRRERRGYEHSLFVTGEQLMNAAEAMGFETTADDRDYGLTFTDEALTVGDDNAKLIIHFYKNGKTTTLGYKEDLGGYLAHQQGAYLKDGSTGENLLFRNVLVLVSDSQVIDSYARLRVQTTGEGTGWYARDGKIIEIKWSRENEDAPFTYTDPEGNPITFGVGKSYVAFVPASDHTLELS